MKRLALLLLALALPAAGASAAVPPAPARGPLARAITLTEVPEAKNVTVPSLPFGTETQDVDVNSTIRIEISKDTLLTAIPPALQSVASRDVDLLLTGAGKLQTAATFLTASIQTATDFTRGLQAGKSTAELQQIAKRDDAALGTMVSDVQSYRASLAAAANPVYQQHAKDASSRLEQAVTSGSRAAISIFLVAELRWTLDQLAAARQRLATDAPPVALFLSATHLQPNGGTAGDLHLKGYDDLPVGVPVSIDKTSLVISAADQKRLQSLVTQSAALAGVLNQAIQGGAELKKALGELLQSRGIDIGKLRADLDKIGQDANQLQTTDWDAVAKKLDDQVRALLNGAVSAADKKILNEKTLPAVGKLLTAAANARTTVNGLRAQALALRSQVGEGSDLAKDPAAALAQILSLADAVLGEGKTLAALLTDTDRWKQVLKELKDQAATVQGTLAGLSASVKSQIQALLAQAAQDQIGTLLTDLEKLRADGQDAVRQAQELAQSFGDPASLALALDREPPATAIPVTFGEIQNTFLDLRTINPRGDNDVVVLRAWLYRVETVPGSPGQVVRKEELAHEMQPLRLLRFGWLTKPSVGIVYTSAVDKLQGQDKQTRAFAPLVSFLWSHRSWDRDGGGDRPLRYLPAWQDSLGFGLHTITLDLDRDNQPELGLGLTLSFFNGYLQIGGGIDLSLKQQKYIFLGTRVFDFARSLGITATPAAPAQ
jgi:hypothetical protein